MTEGMKALTIQYDNINDKTSVADPIQSICSRLVNTRMVLIEVIEILHTFFSF